MLNVSFGAQNFLWVVGLHKYAFSVCFLFAGPIGMWFLWFKYFKKCHGFTHNPPCSVCSKLLLPLDDFIRGTSRYHGDFSWSFLTFSLAGLISSDENEENVLVR